MHNACHQIDCGYSSSVTYDITDDDAPAVSCMLPTGVLNNTPPSPPMKLYPTTHTHCYYTFFVSPLRLYQNRSLPLLFFVCPASSALWMALQACRQSDTAVGLHGHTYMLHVLGS